MIACILITLICVAVFAFSEHERSTIDEPELRRLNSDNIKFSGNGLNQKKFHIWITASFQHGSWSHLVNNMLMMWGYGPWLESEVGIISFFALYCASGACGWALSYGYNKLMYDPIFAEWNISCGSSPSTYGLAVLMASMAPSTPVASFSWLAHQPWLFLAVLYWAPIFFGQKYKLDSFYIKKKVPKEKVEDQNDDEKTKKNRDNMREITVFNWRMIFVPPILCAISYFTMRPLAFSSITAAEFLIAYLIKTFIFRFWDLKVHGVTMGATDNACHLGGSLLGYGLALLYAGDSSCSDLALIKSLPSALSAMELPDMCAGRLLCWVAFTYLIARLLLKF